MKYKVGDKIKIRSWSDMEQEYGTYPAGSIRIPVLFTPEMKKWCGKIVTIKKVHPKHYHIKEDELAWTDEMIYHDATEKIQRIIKKLNILRQEMVLDTEINYLINNFIENPTKLTKKFAIILNNEYKKLRLYGVD